MTVFKGESSILKKEVNIWTKQTNKYTPPYTALPHPRRCPTIGCNTPPAADWLGQCWVAQSEPLFVVVSLFPEPGLFFSRQSTQDGRLVNCEEIFATFDKNYTGLEMMTETLTNFFKWKCNQDVHS